MSPVNKAAQQALEAWDGGEISWFKHAYDRMEALRAALEAQPIPSTCNGACYADGDKCNCGQGAQETEPAPPASELIAVQLLAAAERLAARGWFEPSHCANAETLQDMAAMRAAIQAARDAGI